MPVAPTWFIFHVWKGWVGAFGVGKSEIGRLVTCEVGASISPASTSTCSCPRSRTAPRRASGAGRVRASLDMRILYTYERFLLLAQQIRSASHKIVRSSKMKDDPIYHRWIAHNKNRQNRNRSSYKTNPTLVRKQKKRRLSRTRQKRNFLEEPLHVGFEDIVFNDHSSPPDDWVIISNTEVRSHRLVDRLLPRFASNCVTKWLRLVKY